MPNYLLSYDIGTSSCKATLFTESGKLEKSFVSSYTINYSVEGKAEEDPADWWKAVIICTNELISGISVSDIAVISLCGQMSGVTFLDKKGKILRPSIIWLDNRATEEAYELKKRLDVEHHFAVSGRIPNPIRPIEKIMWIKKHQPDIYKKTSRILQSKDYIAYMFTGKLCTDPSDASCTYLLDREKLIWCDETFTLTDLDKNKFPEIVPSTYVIGNVTDEAARLTGLCSGIPVVMGCGDVTASAIGSNCITHGSAHICIGSSGWVGVALDHPFPDPERTYSSVHAVPGLFVNQCCLSCAGISYKWVSDVICHNENKNFELINEQILNASPCSSGVTFLPYLTGDMCLHNNPLSTASFTGITAQTTRGDLLRAVVEGVCLYLDSSLNLFYQDIPLPDRITLIGGAVKGEPWRRILCDIIGIQCMIPKYCEESTSSGTSILGGIGIGIFKDFSVVDRFVAQSQFISPIADNHKIYEKQKAIYLRTYEALAPLYADMHAIQ